MNTMYPQLSDRIYYSFEEPEQPDLMGVSKETLRTVERAEEAPQVSVPKPGFWSRQFQGRSTKGQRKFDWVFAVILPVICFYFDPIVFRNGTGGIGPALLAKISAFAHVLSFAAVLGTIAWLLWGEKLGWLNASLAGLFVVSSVAALAIGIFISPYSLLGLIVLIGALGFTPFFTSFVLLRNSVRTFRAAKLSLPKDLLVNSFALAAVASAVIPYLINLFY
jgi:hypothetical protein